MIEEYKNTDGVAAREFKRLRNEIRLISIKSSADTKIINYCLGKIHDASVLKYAQSMLRKRENLTLDDLRD